MNKLPIIVLVVSIITLLLVVLLSFGEPLTLEETKKELGGNPIKIAEWIAQNIKYIHDDLGFGQLPERMFKWRKGDCEDFALLAQYFIGDTYETYIVVWHGKFREDSEHYAKNKGRRISHAVVAFKMTENEWGIIDYDRCILYGKSLVDIIKINCDLRRIDIEKAHIMDLRKLRRKIIEKINLEE